jgi:hypothetical protein
MLRSQQRDNAAAASQSAHRRHPRHHLATPLNLWRRCGSATAIPGIALEISESGLSVILPEQLSLGEQVEFNLQLPGGHLRLSAVVRNQTMFRAGLEFQAPSSAQLHLIRAACAALPLYTGPDY